MAVEAPTIDDKMPLVFSDEEISVVLGKLRADPNLVRGLISSGQGGNVDDLKFMLESKRAFWTDVNKGGSHIT